MGMQTTQRYRHAAGPATEVVKEKLLLMVAASAGKEELLGNDLKELMLEVRGPDGFDAVSRRLDEFLGAYPTPDTPVGMVREKLLAFIRTHKLEVGHVLPDKPLRFTFMPSLEPEEARAVEDAFSMLFDEGVLELNERQQPALTEAGFQLVYRGR